MKNYSLFLLSLIILTGCGQVGPLYLPDGPAPIHVAPEPPPKPEVKPEQKTSTEPKSEPEKTK